MKSTKRQLKRIIRKTLSERAGPKLDNDVTETSENLHQEVYFGLQKDIEALCLKYSDNLRYSQHGVTSKDIFEEIKYVMSHMDPNHWRSY